MSIRIGPLRAPGRGNPRPVPREAQIGNQPAAGDQRMGGHETIPGFQERLLFAFVFALGQIQ